MSGTLYLCATPIGNLDDMTFRAIKILREVDLIAAEDTRHTRKLLTHFEIHTPMIRFDENCKSIVGEKILQRLQAGESVAVVSDAGLPAISDPGAELVKLAVDAGIKVSPIPGANAALSALICSGLDTTKFLFAGFAPKTKKNRREILQKLSGVDATIIFYEAPHRLKNFLTELAEVFGQRQAVLARELTKIHEEFLHGEISELAEKISEPRGEFVIVVSGATSPEVDEPKEDVLTVVKKFIADGLDKKSAMREAAKIFNVSRREIYNALIKEDSMKKFYITTPIYYPSAKLHIGHAYCTTIADAIARYKRLAGFEVFFLTGSDEHGQKIQRTAQAQGKTPLEYVDPIVDGFKDLWKKFYISNDDFIRTSEPRHEKVVQEIFKRIQETGDIYKGEYTGLYCTPCESYWTELQLDENGCCPDCHRPVEKVSEEAYFFRLSKYADKLLKHIEDNPEFIVPTSRRNEMINFIKQGLEDLCISRTSFDWGIPVPDDPRHVIYVWFDAVINYITPLIHNPDMKKFWPADIHLVGKEIVRFHTIIWPAMLMAAGFELPKQIYGHGWLVTDGDKMSKSKGNVVDPVALVEEFGADAIRYFLLREITLGLDGNFSRDALIQRINADLANDLGNLLHRTLNMIGKFQKKILLAANDLSDLDKSFQAEALDTTREYRRLMDNVQLSDAVKAVWKFIGRANKYIDETMPWKLAKDETQRQALANVLYNLAESLRIVAIVISPFMPVTAQKIFDQLKISTPLKLDDAEIFGLLEDNHEVGKPEQLFPRIEVEK